MKTVKERLYGLIFTARKAKIMPLSKDSQKDLHKKDPYYELSLIFEGVESLRK